jgi:acetoin utilization deacetylase AcuC-like enzyme
LIEPPTEDIDAAATGIETLHTADYVEALRTGTDPYLSESQGFDWCPDIWTMAVHATAGLIAATDAALTDGVAGSLSSGLHHAKPDRGDGFCTVNGLAIAAHRLVADGSSVVILDLDAHCGGGTAAMIRAHGLTDPVRQFDLSTNTFDGYQTVHPDDRLVVVRRGDEHYIDAVGHMLDGVDWADTDIVLYNAGVDIHPEFSRLTIALRERMVFERAAAEETPIAWVLAGGYTTGITMDELVDLHWQTIDAATPAAKPSGKEST